MIQPGRFDMNVNRWQPATFRLRFEDIDFSAATAALQVRAYRDAGGDPLINLMTGSGIAITTDVLSGYTSSVVAVSFNEIALEGLPFPSPRGSDLLLSYDLVITTASLGKVRWIEGNFNVRAGVTQI